MTIPEDIRETARKVANGVALPYRPLDWDILMIGHAILAERERCAKIVKAERERVLALQDGKDDSVDLNLRLTAVLLPSLEDAIRAPRPTEEA